MHRIWLVGVLSCAIAAGQTRSGDTAARLQQAREYMAKGELVHARQLAEELHAENPRSVAAALVLANCYIKLGRAAEAVEILKPLEPGNESNTEFEYSLTFATAQSTGSEVSLRKMEKIAQATRSAKAFAAAGSARMNRNEFTQAKADFDEALALDPSVPGLNTMSGIVRYALQDPDGAFPFFQAALRENPRDFQANLYDGLYRMQKGEFDDARVLLGFALELEPNSPLARLKMAQLNGMTGKYTEAVSTLEELEQETPEWLDPHVQLAALYYKLHRPEDGERERAVVQRLQVEQQKAGPVK
jgi:Tfp pilus assembly protein PilF